jgi:eukaryotic-like serine/threonine-protein kinase
MMRTHLLVIACVLPLIAAAPPADWPAFHGGGPLRGESASDPGAPPMKTRWTYRTNDDDPAGIAGSAAIVGDTVYVGDVAGTLHAIDLKTGKRRWTYQTDEGDGFETTPLVVGDRVFIGDMAGVFHAVVIKDGKRAWTVTTIASIHSSANAAGDDRIVFGNDGAEIYCLGAKDGKEFWKKTAGDNVNSAPAIGFGAALVSGCDAKLRAIDVNSGEEKFVAELGALSPASPAVLDDKIIVGTDQGRIVCLSADGSKQLWEYTGVESGAMVYSSVAVAGGVAVVGARDRQVHAVDVATGKGLWTFKTKGDVDSSPAVAGGKVYVGSKDKRLYVLDLKTGQKLWEFNAGKAITAGPAVAGGAVIFGDGGGTLYCLEAEKR